jgi:hypothetical protein
MSDSVIITPRQKVEALLDLGATNREENVFLCRCLYLLDKKLGLYGPEMKVLDELYRDRIEK